MYTVRPIHFSVTETFGFSTHTQKHGHTMCIHFDRKYFAILEFNWIIWKAHKVVAIVVIQPQSTQSLSFNWNSNWYIQIGFVIIILIWNILRSFFHNPRYAYVLWNRVQSVHFLAPVFFSYKSNHIYMVQINWQSEKRWNFFSCDKYLFSFKLSIYNRFIFKCFAFCILNWVIAIFRLKIIIIISGKRVELMHLVTKEQHLISAEKMETQHQVQRAVISNYKSIIEELWENGCSITKY